MKKILALMLAGCLALSMAACGGNEKQPAAEENKTETTEPAASGERPRRKKLRTKPAKTLKK